MSNYACKDISIHATAPNGLMGFKLKNVKTTTKNGQTRIKQKGMDMSELCKAKSVGKSHLPTQPKIEDDFTHPAS
jgi:hypothetical protein